MIKTIISFSAGFFLCWALFYGAFYFGASVPLGDSSLGSVSAPSDWVSEKLIEVTKDGVIIKIPKASISRYAPTGSMRPVLDKGANGIRIVPNSPDSIKVGDIVSYKSSSGLIVHRVVEKGTDSKGTYFLVKGDNNAFADGKIRFKDIKYVTVGVIW